MASHGLFQMTNVLLQGMQLISVYELCTIEIPFEERCYYGTLCDKYKFIINIRDKDHKITAMHHVVA